MRASEKIADVLDGNDDPVKETPKTSYTDTTAENKDNLDKKKKAKSHSTIADFGTNLNGSVTLSAFLSHDHRKHLPAPAHQILSFH